MCGIKSIELVIIDIEGGEHKIELKVDDMENKANDFMYQTLSHALGRTIENHLALISAGVISFPLLDDFKAKKFDEKDFSDSRYRFYNLSKSLYVGKQEYKFKDEDDFRFYYKLVEMYIRTTKYS